MMRRQPGQLHRGPHGSAPDEPPEVPDRLMSTHAAIIMPSLLAHT